HLLSRSASGSLSEVRYPPAKPGPFAWRHTHRKLLFHSVISSYDKCGATAQRRWRGTWLLNHRPSRTHLATAGGRTDLQFRKAEQLVMLSKPSDPNRAPGKAQLLCVLGRGFVCNSKSMGCDSTESFPCSFASPPDAGEGARAPSKKLSLTTQVNS